MKKNIILISTFLLASYSLNCFSEDILQNYSSLASKWRLEISNAFDSAEKEVYNILPVPKPDDGPVTDPDPKKCACKGTGIVIHGDTHTTPCPYHSKQDLPQVKNCPDGKCNLMTTKTTCQCETKCGCKPCQCKKVEIK
jgi:hypothetical protein